MCLLLFLRFAIVFWNCSDGVVFCAFIFYFFIIMEDNSFPHKRVDETIFDARGSC